MKTFAWIEGLVCLLWFVGTLGRRAPVTQNSATAAPTAIATDGSITLSSTPLTLSPKERAEGIAFMREARTNYAKRIDTYLLTVGIESTTQATGPQGTTLYITDALCGRVRAKALSGGLEFDKLKSLGFKKVVYTNDFDSDLGTTFTWDVNKYAQ